METGKGFEVNSQLAENQNGSKVNQTYDLEIESGDLLTNKDDEVIDAKEVRKDFIEDEKGLIELKS